MVSCCVESEMGVKLPIEVTEELPHQEHNDMDTNVLDGLQQAYNLIEAGDLENARRILRPILENEKGNPDAWWLYVHAVNDVESARLALNNVLKIDRHYPEAFELMQKLEKQSLRTEELTDNLIIEPSFVSSSLSDSSNMSKIGIDSTVASPRTTLVSDLDTAENKSEPVIDSEPFYRRPLFFIPVIALVLFGALAMVILKPFVGNQSSTSATAIVEQGPLIDATTTIDTAILLSTQQSLLPDQTPTIENSLKSLYPALQQFNIPSDGISVLDTDLGRSGMVDICTKPGGELRETLIQVMKILAREHEIYADRVEAIGTRMLDCENGRTLLIVGVPVESAISYANAVLSEADFQGMWRAILSK